MTQLGPVKLVVPFCTGCIAFYLDSSTTTGYCTAVRPPRVLRNREIGGRTISGFVTPQWCPYPLAGAPERIEQPLK